MIRLSEILSQASIKLNIDETEKDATISGLVSVLGETGAVTDVDQVMDAIRKREAVMSTGIGGGVAVPHAQSPGAKHLALALGRVRNPIEFDALDGRPVQLLFLVVGPEERGGFIRVLARIGRLLYSGDLQRNLLRARTSAEVMDLIRTEETRISL